MDASHFPHEAQNRDHPHSVIGPILTLPKAAPDSLRRVLQGANQFFSPALALPFVIIWVSRSGRNLFHPGP
jgi:hypothetical protein